MWQHVMEIVLVLFLIIGCGYLIYLFRERKVQLKEDYFGLVYGLLYTLERSDISSDTVKKILRAVSDAVSFVESNYKNEPNDVKEDKAVELIVSVLQGFNLKSEIPLDSIKYLIRIACAFLPPTRANSQVNNLNP